MNRTIRILSHFDSPAVRLTVLTQAIRKESRSFFVLQPRRVLLLGLLIFGFQIAGFMAALARLSGIYIVFIGFLQIAVVAAVLMNSVCSRVRVRLARELFTAGIPICWRCDYCLAGSPTDSCPECGTDTSCLEDRYKLPPPEAVWYPSLNAVDPEISERVLKQATAAVGWRYHFRVYVAAALAIAATLITLAIYECVIFYAGVDVDDVSAWSIVRVSSQLCLALFVIFVWYRYVYRQVDSRIPLVSNSASAAGTGTPPPSSRSVAGGTVTPPP